MKATHRTLNHVVKQLVAPGKGILAADESDSTCAKRFDKYGIPKTLETRRKWRELLFTAPKIEQGLSGVILFDETIRQQTSGGLPAARLRASRGQAQTAQAAVPFARFLAGRGILPGIKVDQKTEPFNQVQGKPFGDGEEVTKGLDGLAGRLAEYAKMGATFTKWRAVIRIGNGLPTKACIAENARRMAEYARASQNAGLVPIVEPEVLLDGTHTLARSKEVIAETLSEVFAALRAAGADLSQLLLKSSMALPGKAGKESGMTANPREIAEATLEALFAAVPKEVPGIVFLSGGQTPEEATVRLNEIVKLGRMRNAPWRPSFSYSRALQDPVLKAWAGKDENVKAAQEIFAKRVKETAAASRGEYNG